MAHEDLIDEIERGAIDHNTPIGVALRKCVILGGRSGSEALTDWATRELEGYLGYEGELPQYRVIYAQLMADGATMTGMVQHQQIPQSSIPEFAREYVTERVELRHGAGELEALLLQDDIRLMPHGASDVARLMNLEGPPGQHIISLYWSVAPGAIRGVLDQIRTATTKLVAELRRTMPADQDVPTREQADRAVVFIITGERAQFHYNVATASGDGASASAAHASRQLTLSSGGCIVPKHLGARDLWLSALGTWSRVGVRGGGCCGSGPARERQRGAPRVDAVHGLEPVLREAGFF